MLHKTVDEIKDMDYEELAGWFEYMRRRPFGWREDNRAAIIAMSSLQSDKVKPEDLFESLRVINQEAERAEELNRGRNALRSFLDRFGATLSDTIDSVAGTDTNV